ncbi:zinc finger BED domain-containing protein 5 [Trichonephila clavipes]|nr:zinc finger BED domain-containing protein 5 [Trichonephila clavipes]
MLDERSAKHVSTVPLSNDTVSRRIHDLASYVRQELVTRLQKARFVLQINESTDVAGLAILLVINTGANRLGIKADAPRIVGHFLTLSGYTPTWSDTSLQIPQLGTLRAPPS